MYLSNKVKIRTVMYIKIFCSWLSMLCALTGICQSTGNSSERPNILIFIADDCTFRDISCYGSPDTKTPNIDRLAKEGMLFKNCFQATAMCSPTRHNLLTGLYPVKSGAYPNHTFAKDGTQSIAQYLKPLGYRTALLGKTHINPPEVFPFEYLGDNGDDLDFGKMEEFLASTTNGNQPFFLFVASHQPHGPHNKGDRSAFNKEKVTLPPYYADTEETRDAFVNYLAEVNYMDAEVGRCLELLKKYGCTDNTLVIFTSEQGNTFPFAKWTCYGNGLQTAFVAKWPGRIHPNSISNAMVEYVDVVPTLIDIAGGHIPKVLDGSSFLPVLLGERDTHKEYVYGIQTTRGINNGSDYYGIRTVRSQNFRYIRNLTPEVPFQNVIITGQNSNSVFMSWVRAAETDPLAQELVYKYQYRPAEELFNIQDDPYEMNNLAYDPAYTAIKTSLSEKLDCWMTEQGDQGQETELAADEHLNNARRKKMEEKK